MKVQRELSEGARQRRVRSGNTFWELRTEIGVFMG